MKVYFYVPTDSLIHFNGLLSDVDAYSEEGFYIPYHENHVEDTVMVSVDIDTFVNLTDNNLIQKSNKVELL